MGLDDCVRTRLAATALGRLAAVATAPITPAASTIAITAARIGVCCHLDVIAAGRAPEWPHPPVSRPIRRGGRAGPNPAVRSRVRSIPAPLAAASALLVACAASTQAKPPDRPPWEAAACWRGAAADAANLAAREPTFPALGVLRGRVPLAELARGPWSDDRPDDPVYALALYDDGTLVFEGHRCVKLGGLLFARLGPDTLVAIRELLARSCADFDRASDGEVCADTGDDLRLSCLNGVDRVTGTDHCRADDEQGVRLRALADAILAQSGADLWIGPPAERQACARGAKDLARDEGTLHHRRQASRAEM